jgi:predicted enzyme related to lactoylglutathione lyase
MPNKLAHFAIHADDVERARTFYENAFGWRFEAWGPPGFYRVFTGGESDPGIEGALHKRTGPKAEAGMRGFLCTLSVADINAARAAVVKHGGVITTEKVNIPAVGVLIEFHDTEGNVVQAMQYETPPHT